MMAYHFTHKEASVAQLRQAENELCQDVRNANWRDVDNLRARLNAVRAELERRGEEHGGNYKGLDK